MNKLVAKAVIGNAILLTKENLIESDEFKEASKEVKDYMLMINDNKDQFKKELFPYWIKAEKEQQNV